MRFDSCHCLYIAFYVFAMMAEPHTLSSIARRPGDPPESLTPPLPVSPLWRNLSLALLRKKNTSCRNQKKTSKKIENDLIFSHDSGFEFSEVFFGQF